MPRQQQVSKQRPQARPQSRQHSHGNVFRTSPDGPWRCAECGERVEKAAQARWNAKWRANTAGGAR